MSTDFVYFWKLIHAFKEHTSFVHGFTRKIRAMICLHDSSEIIAQTQNFFSCHLPVVKRQQFFNASYSFHVYLIELMFDVDYRS